MRIIVYWEKDKWVAQLLEHDVLAWGETLAVAVSRLGVAIELEDKEPGGLARIEPSPISKKFSLVSEPSNSVSPEWLKFYQRLWNATGTKAVVPKTEVPS